MRANCLAADGADIEALEVFPELRRAYDDGLIDPLSVGRSELDAVETMPCPWAAGKNTEVLRPVTA
jgi:hypothetical protein